MSHFQVQLEKSKNQLKTTQQDSPDHWLEHWAHRAEQRKGDILGPWWSKQLSRYMGQVLQRSPRVDIHS